MEASDVSRAVAAAMLIAEGLKLPVDDASVLQNSNKLALRLVPCDVFARVAHVGEEVARFEVELAQRLAESGSPVAALDPRVEPRVYRRDDFVVTLWTYYEPLTDRGVSPADFAAALQRLHAGMRMLDVTAPHFTDRVAEAEELVASSDRTPTLGDADRALLSSTLRSRVVSVAEQTGSAPDPAKPMPGANAVELVVSDAVTRLGELRQNYRWPLGRALWRDVCRRRVLRSIVVYDCE